MDTVSLNGFPLWIIVAIALWTLPWKGYALWKAAQLSHKKWFIAILVINSFAILDIIYIYFVARKYTVEITEEK